MVDKNIEAFRDVYLYAHSYMLAHNEVMMLDEQLSLPAGKGMLYDVADTFATLRMTGDAGWERLCRDELNESWVCALLERTSSAPDYEVVYDYCVDAIGSLPDKEYIAVEALANQVAAATLALPRLDEDWWKFAHDCVVLSAPHFTDQLMKWLAAGGEVKIPYYN